MPRHNVIYVDTIVCLSDGLQGLSRCIVGHPTRVNLTSLSRGNHFHRSIKGAYNCKHSHVRSTPSCFHHSDYISEPKIFLSPASSFAICRETFCTFIKFLAAPLLKITNCLVLSLLTNASLFDSQLNCHSDKWPINAQHSSAISVVISTRCLKSFPWDALVYGSIMAFYLNLQKLGKPERWVML